MFTCNFASSIVNKNVELAFMNKSNQTAFAQPLWIAFEPSYTVLCVLYTIIDSMTPSSAFATLISIKQGEKTQKIVAKYRNVCDRFRERERRVKYNLV